MILADEHSTINFAKNLAKTLKIGDIVLLKGNLGAGKTSIAREIIKHFCGSNINVISPTFNILQTYKIDDFTIYHYDLYRLKSLDEIYELGIDEALSSNLCLIEWPEIIEPILPKPYIKIQLDILNESRLCTKTLVI